MKDTNKDFVEIFKIFFSEKKQIFLITFAFTILSFCFSLFLPTIYSSSALLVSSESKSMDNNLMIPSSALSLAGINIPSSMSSSLIPEVVETLKSQKFFEENFLNQINLHDLMAVDSWNSYENIITYDKKIYDNEKNIWVRDFKHPYKQIPSTAESYLIFHKDHFKIIKVMDGAAQTRFYKVVMKHKSPEIAKTWLEIILREINRKYRQDQKEISKASLDYLNMQISRTSFSEIKQALSLLVKKEVEILTLVELNEDYVFKVIDPPTLDEFHDSPQRMLFVLVGFVLGFFTSIMIVLIRVFFKIY